MKFAKTQSKLFIACIALISIAALLKADYYKSDFFPIGLTGLNHTGSPHKDNCPYSNIDYPNSDWDWVAEKALIDSLGVNCIGFGEGDCLSYMGSLDTTECRNRNNYLYRVCIPSFEDDGDSTTPEHIYIIVLEEIPDILLENLPDTLATTN